MKKLMVAIAAVATAFGLYADGTLDNSVDFSGFTDVNPWLLKDKDGNDDTLWSYTDTAPATDEAKIESGKLVLKTGQKVLSRAFAATAKAIGEGLYADMILDLNGETLDEVPDVTGAKLALFALDGTDIEGLPAGTNVYVYAAYGTDGKALFQLKDDGEEFVGSARRIAVKAYENVLASGSRAGFIVFISDDDTAISEANIAKVDAFFTFNGAKWVAGTGSDYLGGLTIASTCMKWTTGTQKSLFVSMDNDPDTADQLAAVEFKGNAALASITLTDTDPGFPPDSQDMEYAVTDATIELTQASKDAGFSVDTDVIVGPAYGQTFTFTVDTEKENVTVMLGETELKLGAGDIYEATLTEGEALTVKGWNAAATVTIDDVDYPCESIADAIAKVTEAGVAAKITLDADAADLTEALSFAGTEEITLDLNGRAITGEVMGGLIQNAGNLKIIDSSDSADGYIDNTAEMLPYAVLDSGALAITGGWFKDAVAFGDAAATINVAGGKFDAAFDSTMAVGTIETTGGNFLASVFGTKTENTIPSIQDGYVVVDDQLANYLTVVEKPKTYVAEIDGEKYESLGAAIDALEGGETITLLANYTMTADETKEIAKSCTLDLGTYTLTVPETIRHKKSTGEGEDGSFGVLAGATVTFQNGTIDLGTVGSSYGIAVYGTVNANCTIVRSQTGTSINGPVFDILGGTVNVGANADITADTDIFRAKEMVKDVDITGTVTVVAGAKLTSTDRHVMFYNYKTNTTMVVTLNGGTLNANSSYGFFGDDNKHPGAPWVVTISPDVVFNCNKIEFGTAVGTVLKDGYGAVARGTDPETYKVDKLTYNVTLSDTTDGFATPATYQISDKAQTVALVAGTAPASKVFDKWVLTAKDGVSIDGDTITIAAGTIGDIAVAATWKDAAVDPVIPGEDIDIPAGKDINDINTNDAVKAELLKAPGNIETTPAYRALFDAVPGSADGKVAFVLNEAGEAAVVEAETVADTTVLDAALDADAETATVENPLVGFYYSLKQNEDVTKLGFKEVTDKNKLGGKDTIQFTLEKGEASEFYQMIVTPAPVVE